MNTRLSSLLVILFFLASSACAQTPAVQLKLKEKSGFLGMGGPRIVKIELSNQNHAAVLTSDSVNAGEYIYFLFTPAGDWQLNNDFVQENLIKIQIVQQDRRIEAAWRSELLTGGNNSVLLGFPKSVQLYRPFMFQFQLDDIVNEVEYTVPQELWPGYTWVTELSKKGEAAMAAKEFKTAIGWYEQLLGNDSLSFFPQYAEAKRKRTRCFDAYDEETIAAFRAAAGDAQTEVKAKIALVDGFKPTLKYILDSLPRAEWSIGSLDSTVAPILDRCRNALAVVTSTRDSLQHILDDQNVRWIIEGSATAKNGYLYGYMIETLASAFSSINFADSTATELKVRISEDDQARLAKYNIAESFETFVRICNERYQAHLALFPIDFLPNLRKDTISFPLPYYSMLKAVNDFYYGNFSSAKDEIIRIFRTCYEPEINNRFDAMRIAIVNRDQHISPDVMKMFSEAEQLEKAKDLQNAQEKYRQITLIAPNFAYGFFVLGKYYNRTGDQIRAIYSYQRAYQIDSLYLSAYRECYGIYLKQSNFKEIISVLTTALARGNDYWEINYDLGVAFLGEGEPARAIKSFERALALNPKSYKTNIQIGLAQQNVKNYQKAREYFNNAIGLDPTRQDAVDYLTRLNELQRTGK